MSVIYWFLSEDVLMKINIKGAKIVSKMKTYNLLKVMKAWNLHEGIIETSLSTATYNMACVVLHNIIINTYDS